MIEPNPSLVPPAGAPFDLEATGREARDAAAGFRAATSAEDAIRAVERWDRAMAAQGTWVASQMIRFRQDTRDPIAVAAKKELDAAAPALEGTRRIFLTAVFDPAVPDARRNELRARYGDTVVDRWACELRAFDPSLGERLREEQSIKSEHMALAGGAEVDFRGERHTLASLAAFATSEDRDLRRDAARARWGWFKENRASFDDQFDRLVRCRTELARGLGRESFTDVAYDRMRRSDYGPSDVAAFRDAIRQHVVPVAARIHAAQRARLGVDRLEIYDEQVFGRKESTRPRGDAEWLESQAAVMFSGIDARHATRLGELFGTMRSEGLLDLVARSGKGPGGFCSFLHASGVPFVFANFNGTADDARVFTHEMGHAYQGWCSHRNLDLIDQRRCTSESAEIHSMALEFLTWPAMELFFEDGANAFREAHISQRITFLLYGCAIDHFQHEIYARPTLTPSERHAVWRELELTYLPWRSWDGIQSGLDGAAWQAQLHVYQYPFYYIDYVLAQLVAFQFLVAADADESDAWTKYQSLCDLGGRHGFRDLVRTAGMGDPFDPDVIGRTVEGASRRLDAERKAGQPPE